LVVYLKSQSEVQKAEEAKEKQRQADQLKFYQKNLHPKMLQLYTFLNEFVEHLNYTKRITKVSYPIKLDGSLLEFNQGDYKVTIDSANEVKEINLRFYCALEFKVLGPVPVNIILQGDIATSSIHLILNNFEKPGVSKHTFKERHITEEFIDDFGKFILRQNPEFLKLDIADEHKEKIRQNIQADIKQRQNEIEKAEADRLLELEQSKEKEKKSWKNLFKKM